MNPIEAGQGEALWEGTNANGEGLAGGARITRASSSIRVLLVEDDDGDALLVEDQLGESLPRSATARSRTLAEALAVVREGVDCVLLDLQLPDATGMDAVAAIRASGPTVPLVVLTGLDDEAAGNAALEAGAQDYLVKGSVDGDALARAIRYAISRRQTDAAERELLLAQAQAQEVTRLERGLAPRPMVTSPSAWVASCSRAGRSRALLGGDFYDVVETPDGKLRLLVGDVCGHGPDEAAVGVALRSAWRALALAGETPELIMRTLQNVFEHERQLPSLFTTLCTLEVSAGRERAEMILAGHPPPVLIAGDTVAQLSDRSGAPPLGLGISGWLPVSVELPAGWVLLLYTDGIIEGRIGPGPERLGEEGLHDLVRSYIAAHPGWRGQPEGMLDALIARAHELNGEALSDDVAMVLAGAGAT